MNSGRTVFAQLIQYPAHGQSRKCVVGIVATATAISAYHKAVENVPIPRYQEVTQ